MNVLDGKKTYIGLLVALAGALGLFNYVSDGDLSVFLNTAFEFGGLAFSAYGRYAAKLKAKPK